MIFIHYSLNLDLTNSNEVVDLLSSIHEHLSKPNSCTIGTASPRQKNFFQTFGPEDTSLFGLYGRVQGTLIEIAFQLAKDVPVSRRANSIEELNKHQHIEVWMTLAGL